MNIEDLLKSKGIFDDRASEKRENIVIKSLKENEVGDGQITIKSLEMDKIQDAIKMAGGDLYKSSVIACYNGIVEPNLKDKKLHEGFGCKTNPHAIVEKLFDPSEIKVIADKITALSGVGKSADEVIEEIKN